MDIVVYNQEIKDGIGEMIKANASIAYAVKPKLVTPNEETINKIKAELSAEVALHSDLYYLDCILASVGWNENHDVFPRSDTFAARNTPVNKPFNYMHVENDIIGHMTASRVLDMDGNIITAENLDDLPDMFDIGVSSVLYKVWADKKLQARMDKTIAEINEGKGFVSMECLFAGFDYAIITPDGSNKVIARNEQSAFLTKHLRAYGGNGEYNGNKVGRLLRNFSFSGKGYVDNPANKRSIIFTPSKAFNGTSASINILTKGRNMESELLKTQLDEAKAALKDAVAENKNLQAKAREEADKAVAEKVANLEKTISELTATVAEKDAAIATHTTKVTELTTAIAEKDAKVTELTTTIDTMKSEAVKAGRLTKLATAGISGEEADKLVAKFASSTDEIFDEFVALKAAMSDKEKLAKEKDKEKKEEAKEAKASEDVTEDKTGESAAASTDVAKLEAEKTANLSADTGKVNDQRAAAMTFITNSVLKTTAKKAGK